MFFAAFKIILLLIKLGKISYNLILIYIIDIILIYAYNDIFVIRTLTTYNLSHKNSVSLYLGCTIDIGIGFDNSRTSSSSRSIFRDQKKLQSYLPEIIRYVSVVHNLCCIRSPTLNTKVGFRLVDANGKMLDDFSFEENNEGVVKKVMALQTSQSLKFNTQLLRSFGEKFRASNSGVKVRTAITKPAHLKIHQRQTDWLIDWTNEQANEPALTTINMNQ